MEIIMKDKVEEIAKKSEVFNFKKEKKKQAILWKEKKNT